MIKQYDIILVSGEPFVDHPFSGVGVIKKVLEDKGFGVGVIESPNWKSDKDFLKLGKPKLFFGVTSGSMDSMLVNYTPIKHKRREDEFSKISYNVPDRTVIVYCNTLKKLFKGSTIVVGGIEASLRRFVHYDYWDNKLRRSILLDSRADILVYGYGELQIVEIAERMKRNKKLEGVRGTCIIAKKLPGEFLELPSHERIIKDKKALCKMQNMLGQNKCLGQKFKDRYVLQYRSMPYTPEDLDYIYSLDYSRQIPHGFKEFNTIKYSVLTHRGCLGGCNFCSISINSGKAVISRSDESIADEVRRITRMPGFKGTVELSGAAANMYGMDCGKGCGKECISCKILDKSHSKMIKLLRKIRSIPKIKNVWERSGIRFDLALSSPKYVREIIKHHVGDKLMIAPEHVSAGVVKLMNKGKGLKEFIDMFKKICKEEKKDCKLAFYMMVGHPGCTLENSKDLGKFISKNENAQYIQIFTPSPMTISTCMYYTSLNPKNMKKVYVPYTYNEKKRQKELALRGTRLLNFKKL